MKIKIKLVFGYFLFVIGFFLLNGCGEKADKVIEEMTLKGTADRGQKTIDKTKKIQKEYTERLKELQAFDNPTNQ